METFQTFSVSKAVAGGRPGLVAKSARFEVHAMRHRCGEPGRRRYAVTFTAIEVLSNEAPRKYREILAFLQGV